MKKEKILLIIAIVLIGIAALGYLPTNAVNMRFSKKIVMEWAIVAVVTFFFIKNIWMKLFLSWLLVRIILTYNQFAYFDFFTAFSFILLYQIIKDKVKLEYHNIILNGICVVGLVQCVMMFFQAGNWWFVFAPKDFHAREVYLGSTILRLKEPFFNPGDNWHAYGRFITGFFGNTGDAGSFLALVFPAFFRRKWWIFVPIVGACIILTHSKGAIIASFLIVLYFIFTLLKKYQVKLAMIWVLLGIYVGSFFYSFTALMTFNGRTGVWGEVWREVILKHPILGIGLGQFQKVFPAIQKAIHSPYITQELGTKDGVPIIVNTNWTFAHNEYLQAWAELGTIGLLIVLGYLGVLFWKSRRLVTTNQKVMFAGLLAMLLTSITWFNFHLTVAVFFIIYLAMYEKEVGI